jgi:hypothetical protein
MPNLESLAVMPSSLPFLASSVVLTAAVCFFFHWPVAPTALLFFVGWPLIGTLITADDDLPGGWSNPDGTVQPPWRAARFWADVVFRLALVFGVFAVTDGWIFWIPCSVALLASFGLMRWAARNKHLPNDS